MKRAGQMAVFLSTRILNKKCQRWRFGKIWKEKRNRDFAFPSAHYKKIYGKENEEPATARVFFLAKKNQLGSTLKAQTMQQKQPENSFYN